MRPDTAAITLPIWVTQDLIDRFWRYVQKGSGCWLWVGALDAYGYGQLARTGLSPIKVHRLSWILHRGPIPQDAHVLHHCDVRNCVLEDDLFLGDQDANMKDAAAKGRLCVPHPNARGRRTRA